MNVCPGEGKAMHTTAVAWHSWLYTLSSSRSFWGRVIVRVLICFDMFFLICLPASHGTASLVGRDRMGRGRSGVRVLAVGPHGRDTADGRDIAGRSRIDGVRFGRRTLGDGRELWRHPAAGRGPGRDGTGLYLRKTRTENRSASFGQEVCRKIARQLPKIDCFTQQHSPELAFVVL